MSDLLPTVLVSSAVAAVLAVVSLAIYDRAGGSDCAVLGLAGPYVHHDAWIEFIPGYTTTRRVGKTTTITVHPATWENHPAYDETPVDYTGGRTWLSGVYPAGQRFLVTMTTGRLTGWQYTGACVPEPKVER